MGGYFSEVGDSTSLDISYDALETVIFFIYTDRCVIGSTAIEVLSAAHQLNLDGLKKKSSDFIGKNIDESNAFDLFKLSDMYNAPKLKLLCSNFFVTPEYQKKNLPDLTIYPIDKSTKFYEHKCLLASHSKYFFDLFYYDEKEYNDITVDLSSNALDWFVRCFTGKVSLLDCPPKESCELLIFADKFKFDLLAKKARLSIQGSSKPIDLLYFMFELKCEDQYLFDDVCYAIIQKYYGKYSTKPLFKDLIKTASFKNGDKDITKLMMAKFQVYQQINHPNLFD